MTTPDLAVKIKRLDPQVEIPSYSRAGDAGMDLHAAEDAVLAPFERKLIPCGFALALPSGYGAFVLPRSGLAACHGISIVNAPGLIDSNYRGEIKVVLVNLDPRESFEVKRNDRIAQMLIMPVPPVAFEICDDLDETERGAAGFGSSGLGVAGK